LTHRFKATKMSTYSASFGLGAAMFRATLIIVCAPLIAACAIEKTYFDVSNSERGPAQLHMDGAACQMALEQSPAAQPAQAGNNTGTTMVNIGAQMMASDDFFDACMLSRGWSRK
jgi:hypothetical protein